VRRLRAGEVLLMFADIVAMPGVRTLEVDFLGGRVRLPAGPATLARMSGATIVPLAVLPVDRRAWVAHLGDPIPAPPVRAGKDGDHATLQRLAAAWGDVIARSPEWWAAVYPLDWVA
jgi:KDO2-lipid IV(A) lauroyltransferase